VIGILPTARPDELVYSVVANYARGMYSEEWATPSSTGWIGLRTATQYGLCDSPHIISERYEHAEAALEELWTAHSLLPYGIAAFMMERRVAVKKLLFVATASRGEVLAEALLIPIGARRIALGLRWCPECADVDRRRFAKPYWHREHQLPGTAICIKHDIWLRCTNGVVRKRLYASPDDLCRSELRPASRRKIPEPVRRIARLDADWLAAAASIDPMQLRYMLLHEFLQRSECRRKPGYAEGWSAIDATELKRLQRHWLDAGTSSFWTMQRARLVRAAFALGKRDVIAAKILPLMAYLGLNVGDVQRCNWSAELDALLDARGADARPVQASSSEWRAQQETIRRLRKNENQRRWRQNNPERVRAYVASWRERQGPEAVRERARAWRQRNREKVVAYQRMWRHRNRERMNEYRRKWRQRYQDRVRARR
jgi:hypothetical protein